MKTFTRIILLVSIIGLSIDLSAQLKVESNGNVRIGTHRPYPIGGKLQITGINETIEARIFVSSNNIARLWTANSINALGFGIDENAVGHIYRNINSPVSIMTFKNNGFIGIGRDPSYSLDVNGNIRANTTIYSSDERMKTDIKPIGSLSNKLYNLNGISYKLNNHDSESSSIHYGFIAQEVINFFPELVYKDDNGILGIDYISFIPLLINELKQQKEHIKQLENEINTLRYSTIYQHINNNTNVSSNEVLHQNYPNPFKEYTIINLYLSEDITSAALHIYDLSGKQIKSYSINERGDVTVNIKADELKTGIYIYSLTADQKTIDTKTFIITE